MTGDLFRRRKLPHWDVPGATYFVTSCLAGSIPAAGFAELNQYRAELDRRARPVDIPEDEWEHRCQKLLFARLDDLLDGRPAVRHLSDARLARIVQDGLLYFAETRCDVFAFVVMPSHFHWVFRPTEDYARDLGQVAPRERLMLSVKTFTGRACNRELGHRGAFWQQESYDHWPRDLAELDRIIAYVEANPVKAGLCARPEDWTWSSARWRVETGTAAGRPLPRIRNP